nr:protein-export chaperone SecB [uncultured Draconibacterium sp.]
MKEDQVTQAPFKFRDFVFAESSIRLNPDTKATSIDIKINPSGLVNEKEKTFEIALNINLTSDDGLDVKVKMIGNFEFKEVVKLEYLNNYFFVNAPAIIFPYLRSYVSALTALSGCKTVIIPPMNMTALGKNLEKNTHFIKNEEKDLTGEDKSEK